MDLLRPCSAVSIPAGIGGNSIKFLIKFLQLFGWTGFLPKIPFYFLRRFLYQCKILGKKTTPPTSFFFSNHLSPLLFHAGTHFLFAFLPPDSTWLSLFPSFSTILGNLAHVYIRKDEIILFSLVGLKILDPVPPYFFL